MSSLAARGTADFVAAFGVLALRVRRIACVISGVLLASVSARAEAPVLPQEFWDYMVEFGDGKGELFDPSDYAVIVNLPARAREEIDHAPAQQRKPDVPSNPVEMPVVEEPPR